MVSRSRIWRHGFRTEDRQLPRWRSSCFARSREANHETSLKMNAPERELMAQKDDVWVASTCSLCYGTCSNLVHRVDGTAIKIEGNPDSAVGRGRLCGKGVSGLMSHYDPNRLKVPLRRTNPKKGIDEDPGWKEISWDEALDEIA